MKNAAHKFLIAAIALILSGCAVTPKEITETKQEEAIAIFQLDSSINGEPAKGFGKYCLPAVSFADTKAEIKGRHHDDFTLTVIKAPPGTVQITGFYCSEFRGLYNRRRGHTLKTPLTFNIAAGKVNYAGKLHMNYTPSVFSPGDLVFGGLGGSTNEEYRITMKLTDDAAGAQAQFLKAYGAMPEGFTFARTSFNNHPQLQK